ncbi:hypothetical protein AWB74_05900 [Caballeronia arvi]|uniref:Uncharacterized protein n=1 Tax=Caballeronia arvi TaxID=1777135 RepID=A0A158KJB2_9BURK|nr:hypothetical protein [Caballeronia arvi]SAL81232.1 hypothetical protein AWB74_05900 [Caballeronia arvi]
MNLVESSLKNDSMLASVLVTREERELLSRGLEALLRERSTAFQIASAVARAGGQRELTVQDFNLPDILRLCRSLEQSD